MDMGLVHAQFRQANRRTHATFLLLPNVRLSCSSIVEWLARDWKQRLETCCNYPCHLSLSEERWSVYGAIAFMQLFFHCNCNTQKGANNNTYCQPSWANNLINKRWRVKYSLPLAKVDGKCSCFKQRISILGAKIRPYIQVLCFK